jgi:hypothetical protein
MSHVGDDPEEEEACVLGRIDRGRAMRADCAAAVVAAGGGGADDGRRDGNVDCAELAMRVKAEGDGFAVGWKRTDCIAAAERRPGAGVAEEDNERQRWGEESSVAVDRMRWEVGVGAGWAMVSVVRRIDLSWDSSGTMRTSPSLQSRGRGAKGLGAESGGARPMRNSRGHWLASRNPRGACSGNTPGQIGPVWRPMIFSDLCDTSYLIGQTSSLMDSAYIVSLSNKARIQYTLYKLTHMSIIIISHRTHPSLTLPCE